MEPVQDLMTMEIPKQDSFMTREAARQANAVGWRLVCTRCGRWGAFWCSTRVPQYVQLPLCSDHALHLRDAVAELMEHQRRVQHLQQIVYHQPVT